MGARKPSTRSQTRSSAAPSRAGSAATRTRAGARAALPADPLELLARADGGAFPASIYLGGDDEALKTEFLAGLRRAWAVAVPGAPPRVMRMGEDDVDAVLTAYQGISMFTPRELVLVLGMEHLVRGSEKRIEDLAAGLGHPAGESCLVLLEAAADAPRKTLAPLRAACAANVELGASDPRALLAWGRRRVAAEGLAEEPGALEALLRACENESVSFLSELGKLVAVSAAAGRVTAAGVASLARPVVGAGLEDYLAAVAAGDAGLAAQRLGRLLAAGESEGSVLWALGNMVAGAAGTWSRHRDLAAQLARRLRPQDVARALDAVYRAEAAWKGGRVDAMLALEQATREVAGAAS
jgi:DNA polymerase III delta subunit